MQGVNIYQGERDLAKKGSAECEVYPGHWELCRPIGYIGFFYKVRCAWRVLIGKADIVEWGNFSCCKNPNS